MEIKKNQWNYKIQEIKKEGEDILIRVGNEWKEEKILKWEGFRFFIPVEAKDFKKIIFGITEVKKEKYPNYELILVSQQNILPKETQFDIGNEPNKKSWRGENKEIITCTTIPIELLSKWTGISSGDIRRAFNSVNLSFTYNLLKFLPRTITITKKEAIVWRSVGERIKDSNSLAIRDMLAKGEHPIDN